ncbi:MAG TPA: response regulator, partial [Ktedonobacteraceae bacterium]|nr:response regulator [Ktedonobacteraceae bacterium]
MRSRPRVLVIDDSPTTCLFIAATLEQAGFDIDIALKGQEGLAKVTTFQPSCLILDVMLPDISGYAVCRNVQQGMLEQS